MAFEPFTPEDIRHRFTNHPPADPGVAAVMDELTERFIDLGHFLCSQLPVSRELALAVTHLEHTSMWSKAAVARNQDTDEAPR